METTDGHRTQPTSPAASRPAPAGCASRTAAATAETSIEARVLTPSDLSKPGESRSLTTAAGSAGPITPPELSAYLWDRLRPATIALAAGCA
jgi:hypothetical protein